MPEKQRQRPWDPGEIVRLRQCLIAPLFAFGDSVIDAFNPTTCNPTTWAFEGSIDVNPGATGAVYIPPTRFWRFSHQNTTVLDILLKDQKPEIIAENPAWRAQHLEYPREVLEYPREL